jgi:uncharacterized damage-inducible protein DinB
VADGGIVFLELGSRWTRELPATDDEHEEPNVRQLPDPTSTSERDALGQYLDWQRETVLLKTEGLSKEQLGQRIPTSDLTLAGLLYHLAFVEEDWFEVDFLGQPKREEWQVDREVDPDFDFRVALSMEPGELRLRYRQACDRSRQITAAARDLDQLSVSTAMGGKPFTLRWMLLHLIEETARHAGHADLLREAIDGTVGE